MKYLVIPMVLLSLSTAYAEYPNKSIAGTYKYAEKGMKGTMKIEVAKYADVRIETTNPDGGCYFEGMLFNEDSKGFPTQGVDMIDGNEGSASFKIKFSGKNAVITVSNDGNNCGMPPRGDFGGKWTKIK